VVPMDHGLLRGTPPATPASVPDGRQKPPLASRYGFFAVPNGTIINGDTPCDPRVRPGRAAELFVGDRIARRRAPELTAGNGPTPVTGRRTRPFSRSQGPSNVLKQTPSCRFASPFPPHPRAPQRSLSHIPAPPPARFPFPPY
jgi:hypothetical protein